MKSNVGSTDKIIRIIIPIVVLYAAYTGMVASPWNYVLYVAAGIMVFTSVMGCCPLFSIFGVNT